MDIVHQLVSIFCEIDDFCKELDEHMKNKLLEGPMKRPRGPDGLLSISEIMTILVMFQMIRYRDFKTFYCGFLCLYWVDYFPHLPSYHRFIELMKRAIFPLTLFAQIHSGKQTGIYYIDSSCLSVCHPKRHKRHKVFKDIAEWGRTSIGWFFGLKMHLVTNDRGELMAFKMTRGSQHDAQSGLSLLEKLKGLAFGDKGYLGKKIFEQLLSDGLKLITRKRKNMKDVPVLTSYEQQLLNQRNIIETVIDHLKHHYQVWHTRHRSILNALTHLVAALAAYSIEPLKLSAIKLLQKTPS